VPLPNTVGAREKLRREGIERPVHNNGHFNANRYIEMRLNNIREKFRNSPSRDSIRIDNEIRKEFEKIEKEVKERLVGIDRLTSANENHYA
jgi:hypothetical protein